MIKKMKNNFSSKKIGKCKICTNRAILIGHHLSYLPEKIIKICYQCHFVLHWLARNKKIRSQVMDLVYSYEKNWITGQYSNSERKKLYIQSWKKSDNGRTSQKKYSHSKSGKESHLKYDQSPKGKGRYKKYDASEKGKATRFAYLQSGRRKLINQKHDLKK